MDERPSRDDAESYRREAVGAFAHEIRTPLTSLRMVLELARGDAGSGGVGALVMDHELAAMFEQSIAELQALADDLQDMSRMERGKAALAPGPARLDEAIAAARSHLAGHVRIHAPGATGIEGPWDPHRLARAIAGFASSVNRVGDGSGDVALAVEVAGACLELRFRSGELRGTPRRAAADAGFPFFHARQFVLASGGSVHETIGERSAELRVRLPLQKGSAC